MSISTDTTICRRCIIPEGYPGTTFSEEHLCSYCQDEPSPSEFRARRASLQQEIRQLFQTVRGERDYDCLVAYSGGKDSSYALWMMSEQFGLRCLAITVDNGFISPQALTNCNTFTDAIGVDHVLYKPSSAFMKTVYIESLKGDIHPKAAILRASSVCNSCIGLINTHMIKTAYQMEIPIVAGGYLGGQVPKDMALYEFKHAQMARARSVTNRKYAERFGDQANRYFSINGIASPEDMRLFIVNPLLAFDVDEETIYSKLNGFGWMRPKDTGLHSSNCQLNDLGILVHLKQHGFHPYIAELAEQVRRGMMDRDTALERVRTLPKTHSVQPALEKLNLDPSIL